MGNVMTPFSPPEAAFVPKVVNVLASGPYTSSFYIDITAAQAKNNIFYLSGSATAPGTFTATSALVCFNFPTTASTKVYTFNVGNITLATALSYDIGITIGQQSGAPLLQTFGVNTSVQVAYNATGYSTTGAPSVRIISATNISFASS